MGEWDELGNVAAQWWMLLQVAVLLTRIGLDRPAALLIGAFRENAKQTYLLLGDEDRFHTAVATLGDRLGTEAASAAWRRARSSPSTTPPPWPRATIAALRSDSPDGRRPGPQSLPVAAARTVGARPADRG